MKKSNFNHKKIQFYFIAVFLFLCASSCYNVSLPSDDKMIENFKSNRESYVKLLKMILEDDGIYEVIIDQSYSTKEIRNKKELSIKRRNEYSFLINKIGILNRISAGSEKNMIYFDVATTGVLYSASSLKGLIFFKDKKPNPDEVVGNLDSYVRKDRRSYEVYRQIEDGWYLYLAE